MYLDIGLNLYIGVDSRDRVTSNFARRILLTPQTVYVVLLQGSTFILLVPRFHLFLIELMLLKTCQSYCLTYVVELAVSSGVFRASGLKDRHKWIPY